MHAAQAGQRPKINLVVADREILPFNQRITQIARKIGVFEIGFVVRPRRQQNDQRRTPIAVPWRPVRQAVLHGREKSG